MSANHVQGQQAQGAILCPFSARIQGVMTGSCHSQPRLSAGSGEVHIGAKEAWGIRVSCALC
jgi:hypothetical protein